MATVEAHRSKKSNPPQPAEPAEPKPRRRFGRWIALALLAASLYFAPAIVGSTPLGQWILTSALHLDGTLTLGSASLGWFSPVVVENLAIVDQTGALLLQVDSLRSDKPLIAMLLDLADLGRFHVEQLTLHLVAREKDSNLEQVFAELLSRAGGSPVSAQLVVTAGTITIDDTAAGRQFRVENLTLDCSLASTRGGIDLAASGVLADKRQPGNFKIDVHTQGSAPDQTAALASGKVDCQSTAIPLELLEPLLRRRIDRAQLSGRLSTRLNGAWGEMAEGGETSVRGEALATGFVFTAAALGDDRIQLERLEMPCHIVQSGEMVQIEQLAIQCELGQLALSGSAKLDDFSARDGLAALAREDYEVTGEADLARLAAMLPATLRIRQGTEITSGQAALVISSRPQSSVTTWTGHVDASRLAATADGRALTWENPL
ncbi:MAG: hypothetical protein HY288_13990, partial [Planctomycetia bacterium]|nr:hypothetical protein [Planctomycetia bacterium]